MIARVDRCNPELLRRSRSSRFERHHVSSKKPAIQIAGFFSPCRQTQVELGAYDSRLYHRLHLWIRRVLTTNLIELTAMLSIAHGLMNQWQTWKARSDPCGAEFPFPDFDAIETVLLMG